MAASGVTMIRERDGDPGARRLENDITTILERDGDPGAWRWENGIAMRDDFYLTIQITSRRPYNIKRCLHISHLISGRYDLGRSCRHTHVNV